MMMKRGKVDKQEESIVASYRYLEVSNPGLQMILKLQVCGEYGNKTREHQSGYQSSYRLHTG